MRQSTIVLFKQIPLSLRYGILLALGLILLKTLEYQLFSYRFSIELYTGLIAAFFMLMGIALSIGWLHFRKNKSVTSEDRPVLIEPLTAKERKVLQGLTEGLSNQQLADQYYLSVNTIKTHLKNIYRKLSVSNRAEAVAKAKRLSFTA